MTDYRLGLSIRPITDDLGDTYDGLFVKGDLFGVVRNFQPNYEKYEPWSVLYGYEGSEYSYYRPITMELAVAPVPAVRKPKKRRTYTEAYGLRRPK
ncbi:hypothetical protein FGG20_gp161 [Mycobacterium phage Baka]|uniref:Uncharacterized protein n=1 Tax=Mycobacterium phage Baka TaxID=2902882 RepID=G1D0B9_9CAUD|nr:hypothetical protein FGG20_gp161 [Mycobacterium phage Baka]AEK08217.1 hypothetical protein PBI_BAKA_161 [Mycobacterium phage Baka]ATN89872.1 hypothetical protein SEA_KLEIN_159 [Mycobacterium phage Klein]